MTGTDNAPQNAAQGKKIFLLYPPSVVQDDVLDTLIMAGYETYTLRDYDRARRILRKFPDSVMFINIEDGQKEPQWEKWIREVMTDPATKGVRLGIMSYNADRRLMQKYLMDLALPCGYVQLKLGIRESVQIIVAALEAVEARGRRRYIRADCAADLTATLNFMLGDNHHRGKLLDISSAGVAAKVDKVDDLPPNTMLKEVQLQLRGGLTLCNMIYMGRRHDDKNILILLFDPKMHQDDKVLIHRYIKQCLQKYIDNLKV